jgi:folate-binding protein YgfZ
MKTLEDGTSMLAAFPNEQGRLLAVVRVVRHGDKFLFETEEATREKVFNNLFRFTYAGDFFVEDISENYRFVSVFGKGFLPSTQPLIEFEAPAGHDYFISLPDADDFFTELRNVDAVAVSDDVYETLRIESGIPKYGVDMDETTIVPELGIEGLISYNKGCYIGQEIIARIHFRGHIAKKLTGLIFSAPATSEPEAIATGSPANQELTTSDGKNAGRITSVTYSPKLAKTIALGFVRYDYLADGTELLAADEKCTVKNFPFL